MDPLLFIQLLIAVMIVFPLIRYLMAGSHDSDIHAYLLSKGATDINVSYSYMLSNGNSQVTHKAGRDQAQFALGSSVVRAGHLHAREKALHMLTIQLRIRHKAGG